MLLALLPFASCLICLLSVLHIFQHCSTWCSTQGFLVNLLSTLSCLVLCPLILKYYSGRCRVVCVHFVSHIFCASPIHINSLYTIYIIRPTDVSTCARGDVLQLSDLVNELWNAEFHAWKLSTLLAGCRKFALPTGRLPVIVNIRVAVLCNPVSKQWTEFITVRCLTGAVTKPYCRNGDRNFLHNSVFVWFCVCVFRLLRYTDFLQCAPEHGSELTLVGRLLSDATLKEHAVSL